MSYDLYFQLLSFILIPIFIYHYFANKAIKIECREASKYDYNVEEGFKLLDYLIETEFNFSIELIFEGKDIKRISDYEENVIELCNGVVNGINPFFLEKMIAQGISEDYIFEYINRGIQVKMLTYMKDNNTGIKPESDVVEE